MMGFRVLLIKELREQLRTGRLIAVAAVFVLFGILGPLTDRYMKELIDAMADNYSKYTAAESIKNLPETSERRPMDPGEPHVS